MLIFLTGQDEIESAVRMIRDVSRNLDPGLPRLCVLPLYAALPSHMQLRVFEPTPEVEQSGFSQCGCFFFFFSFFFYLLLLLLLLLLLSVLLLCSPARILRVAALMSFLPM